MGDIPTSWFNGYSLFANYPTTIATTSTQDNFIGLSGDTMRLTKYRTIESEDADGLPGELCMGYDKRDGKWYIYLCIEEKKWVRMPFPTTWS